MEWRGGTVQKAGQGQGGCEVWRCDMPLYQ